MTDSSSTLLELQDVSVAFPGAGPTMRPVRSVTLSLLKGEILGIVGESGSGKTMVSKAIMRLLPRGGCIESGAIRLGDTELTTLDPESMRQVRGRQIGMIFQEPMMSLNPAMRIGRQMAEAFPADASPSKSVMRSTMIEMLERVRMPEPDACLHTYPHEFSGGMRQRIMLATALLMRPQLLIADEPTTALDVLIQKEVLDLMMELVRDFNTAVILISHDLGLVARYADRVCVMRDGEVVESGAASDILSSPKKDYTKQLLNSLPQRAQDSTGMKPRYGSAPMVSVDNLHVEFGRRRFLPWTKNRIVRAVDGVSASIYAGETVAVVGESGSGKTTLGRAILRLVDSASGSIVVDGNEISRLPERKMRRLRSKLQIVYQDPFSSLDPRMRVNDVVAEGLRHSSLSRTGRAKLVTETLDEVGLSEEFARRFPHELSGGQRQRVSIARAIVMRPDLIVTDEAVSALDVTVQARVLALLKTLQEKHGFSYLFITHDIGVVDQVADRVLVMYRGRIVESGLKSEVLDNPRHPYTCRLLEAVPRLEKSEDGGFQSGHARFEAPSPPAGFTHDQRYLRDANAGSALLQVNENHYVAYSVSG